MSPRRLVVGAAVSALAVLGTVAVQPQAGARAGSHEVWVVDQSDTAADGGGTLYIYDGADLARARTPSPEVIDLGGAARSLCLAETGSAPRRPHMLEFDPAMTHGVLTFVATGHVLFVEAATRQPVACIDVGEQAHAALPSPDGTSVVVANQNGKLLQRISADFPNSQFTLDEAATVNLATCATPSGAACQDPTLRPDNAPICPVIDSTGRLAFVTLRGGGLLVVDATTTPMAIVAEYDRGTVDANGCGGVEARGKMYINSGGGTAANPVGAKLYTFALSGFSAVPLPPNTPAPTLVFSHDDRGFVDSHGATLVARGSLVWVADRAANSIVVVETMRNRVINEFSLVGRASADPAPDLLKASPSGDRVYVTLRGPNPLTANVPGVNNAVGATPGLGVIQGAGAGGSLRSVAPISNVVGGVERADPHGLAVRLTSSR